jgi:diaminohydroxyphosphoribosylaminopyrimidine deaminase/5-amino-6-(5-phosphoribosylamino)uracil reductase
MSDLAYMRLALRLARRAFGDNSPNPMVGALLVKDGAIIGRGWHHRAGQPHAEIEALRDAQKHGNLPRGATLYVTLEPCCTHGRTPPCTSAIMAAGIRRVVVGTSDPNPQHAGRGFKLLAAAGIKVALIQEAGQAGQRLAADCARLNEAFNHWIVHRTPFVIVKAAMTLDGKIATASGQSKWITGETARAYGQHLRQGSDAILVGVNTILADNPSLTVRTGPSTSAGSTTSNPIRRLVLDGAARTPLRAAVISDPQASWTTIVVGRHAPKRRVAALARRVNILVAPAIRRRGSNPAHPMIDLRWLLKKLGQENVTSLLVEGGGEVNASFLLSGLAQRVAFFYAPKVLGGTMARHGVAGDGARNLQEAVQLHQVEWRKLGDDLLLTALAVPCPELKL